MRVRENPPPEAVNAILRHLPTHRDAADTSEGIARWWMPADHAAAPDAVLTALARLEAQGLVHRRTNADRHVLYSR